MLFQLTWKVTPALQWNDKLPDTIQRQVKAWCSSDATATTWVPRALTTSDLSEDCTFHVFCDSSEVAYCAVVYAVQNGESRLLMAKGRLAPINPRLTIPRLELMAALIGVRLMSFIRNTLDLETPAILYWTDSTDVIWWLRNPRPRNVFVENRVASRLQLTKPEQCNQVRGTENPADIGTRGIRLSELRDSEKMAEGTCVLIGQPSTSIH